MSPGQPHHCLAAFECCYVRLDEMRSAPRGGHRFLCCPSCLPVAVVREKYVAGTLRKRLCDRKPDAFRPSGDQDSHRLFRGPYGRKSFIGQPHDAKARAPNVQRCDLLGAHTVAREDRFGDGFVFVELFLSVTRSYVGLKLHPKQVDLHQWEHALQFEVPADLQHRIVEMASFVEKRGRSAVISERTQTFKRLAHFRAIVVLADVVSSQTGHQTHKDLKHDQAISNL